MAADQMLDIPTVATRLKTSKKTVYRRIHAGELKAVNVGARGASKAWLRVRESAVEAYLKAREVSA